MILTIALTSLIMLHNAVYGNYYHNRNTTIHMYGPNVCTFEELLPGNGLSTYRERYRLLDGRQLQTCGRNTVLRYECCEGFKSMYGRPGCVGVKSPKNVLETAQELGARQFVQYIKQFDLHDLLTSGGPYTIFAPTDEAFTKMDNRLRLALDSHESATEILKYHIVPQRIITQNISADEMLNTLNDGFFLRFNKKYSSKIETINCVTIMRKNRIAQNGVIHLINTVLNPNIYSSRNLVQTINQNRELKIFSKMLEVSRMHQSLKETFQTFTVLVPSDTALQKFPQNQLQRILNDENLSKAFVLKHLLPTPVCLSAITEDHFVKSLADKHYIKFSCDEANSVMVQGNCISNDFKLLNNGMLYIIDFSLSTEEGKSTLQIMQQLGLNEFLHIINIAGLAQIFENFNTLTVFAPTNKAMRCMNPMELYLVRSNPGAARMFIEYHVGKEIITPKNIYDGKVIESLARRKELRLQCVQNNFAVEGHQLNFQTPVGYNGVVHVIDKVLSPSLISFEDLIRRNESFSYYAQAIDLLGASTWTSFEFCGSHNTYFVPTNYAFKKLGTVELNRIFSTPMFMRQILNNHQVNRILPSELIKEQWQYDIQTKNKIVHVVNSDKRLTVNNAEIIEADIMTTNGIVHIVNDLILL